VYKSQLRKKERAVSKIANGNCMGKIEVTDMYHSMIYHAVLSLSLSPHSLHVQKRMHESHHHEIYLKSNYCMVFEHMTFLSAPGTFPKRS